MTRPALDLLGRNFGNWTIIGREGSSTATLQARWRGRCVCGAETVRDAGDWKKATKNSACPACLREFQVISATRHGDTGTYLHQLWGNIKKRCCSPGFPRYEDWGGRGIAMHAPWIDSYEAFARYVRRYLGERPSPNHSLDRRNNNGNYEPGNLRWATRKEQAQNKRPYRKRKGTPNP